MSRLVETIHLHRSDMTIRRLPNILKVLKARLEAPAVELTLAFPYFIEKKAPVWCALINTSGQLYGITIGIRF